MTRKSVFAKWASLTTFTTVVMLSVAAGSAIAGPIVPANWSTLTSGTIAGVNITMQGLSSPVQAIVTRSYTSLDYSAAPVSNVTAIMYGASNSWSATFGSPLPNLLLYVDLWRGSYTTFNFDPTTNYTFSLPFTVLSGLSGASISGNTLTLPDTIPGNSFYDGIIEFSGPITSLSVISNGENQSGQNLTFATSVPEPSTLALASISGVAVLGYLWRRRRRIASHR